jgi:PAS domain S-box-containing protein
LREAYLRSMLDNLPYLAWLKNTEGKFQVVNQPFAKAAGKARPSDLVGLDDFAIWPHELAARYVADDQEVMRDPAAEAGRRADLDRGELRWVETFKSPVFDAAGKVIGTTGLGTTSPSAGSFRRNSGARANSCAPWPPTSNPCANKSACASPGRSTTSSVSR